MDLISRQAAIDAMKAMYRAAEKWLRDATDDVTKARAESCMASLVEIKLRTENLPAVQPDHTADIGKKVSIPCAHENDLVSRKAAIEAINGMIDRFERLLADIRESKVDDSVCGMCEYDGAYMGQSGDWCNECPGFDKDDCFKLSDRCRKRWMGDIVLPSAQPEQRWIPVTERLPENDNEVLITVWDAEDDYVEVYKGFYQGHEWWTQWCHGCSKIKDEPCGENIVIAWMPLPASYKGE